MAHFNGKWKLVSSKDSEKFWKAVGLPDAEIKEAAPLEDPANNCTMEIKIDGNKYEGVYFLGGKEIFKEEFTIGEDRTAEWDGKQYKVSSKLDGDVLLETSNRADIKECRYRRYVTGDKQIVEVECDGGVKSVKEFVKC